MARHCVALGDYRSVKQNGQKIKRQIAGEVRAAYGSRLDGEAEWADREGGRRREETRCNATRNEQQLTKQSMPIFGDFVSGCMLQSEHSKRYEIFEFIPVSLQDHSNLP